MSPASPDCIPHLAQWEKGWMCDKSVWFPKVFGVLSIDSLLSLWNYLSTAGSKLRWCFRPFALLATPLFSSGPCVISSAWDAMPWARLAWRGTWPMSAWAVLNPREGLGPSKHQIHQANLNIRGPQMMQMIEKSAASRKGRIQKSATSDLTHLLGFPHNCEIELELTS